MSNPTPLAQLPTTETAKQHARALRAALAARDIAITHGNALELIAVQHGFANWNILAAAVATPDAPVAPSVSIFPRLEPAIPILRIFDATEALRFYRDWLGFSVAWEHRFAPDMPLYMELTRDECRLHLSQHYGDASPGGATFIWMTAIDAFHAELQSRPNAFMRPGLEALEWGRQLAITDPFSNHLRFCEAIS